MTARSNWNHRKFSLKTLGLLAALWSLPPMIHQILHRCPVRPDGINQADAVPAYARKYGVSCMQCHTAYPTLNAYGRLFKLNGYVRSKGSDEGAMITPDGSLHIDKLFPWGVVVRSRLYDYKNTDTNSGKIQGISDLDLFIASGDVAKNVSIFAEVDANASNNFSASAGDLQAGYHPYKFLNFLVARRGFFVMDPYQTLSNFGSPTVANRAIAGAQPDQGSLSNDTMDETKQTVAAYGQVSQQRMGSVYYAIGASADKNDDAGAGPKDGSVRLAFSTPKDNFMIGTFGTMGKEGPSTTTIPPTPGTHVQFSKTGVDAMAEVGGLVGRAAYLYAFDKDLDAVAAGTQPDFERNRAAYVEFMYVYTRGDSDTPFLVPLIRQNWYQTANGTRQFAYLTAQLAHYFTPNLKAFVEYSADTKQDITSADLTTRQPKGSRVTLQAELGF
jgi:hypothetical protein